MTNEELSEHLRHALQSLILDQWELAVLDVGERTVTSHLFRYLADELEGMDFDVDHEYNRRYDLTKSLAFEHGDDLGERRIFPDLVVHRRYRADSNLVVIEAKKGFSTTDDDDDKISAMLARYEYLYAWGVLLALGIVPEPNIDRVAGMQPYRAWAPRWEWRCLDEGRGTVVSYEAAAVFGGDEIDALNQEGWSRWSRRFSG